MDVTRGVHLREENQEDFTAVVIEMSALKKKVFPAFLLAFQVVFLILFGVFVTYDKVVPPDGSVEVPTDSCLSPLESTRSTTKTYPCELMRAVTTGPRFHRLFIVQASNEKLLLSSMISLHW